jgi:hypothetical protein
MLQQQQQVQQQSLVLNNLSTLTTTAATPSTTSTVATSLKRKPTSTVLEVSNNSTKKLNEPAEICSECSIIFPTGLDLKKHIDLAHQVPSY